MVYRSSHRAILFGGIALLGFAQSFLPPSPVTSKPYRIDSQLRRKLETAIPSIYQPLKAKTKLDEEIESLQLDESKLPEEEQEYIRQLRKRYNIEDLVIRNGVIPKRTTEDAKGEELHISKDKGEGEGADEDVDHYEDELEIEVVDTRWSGQAGLEVARESTSSWSDIPANISLFLGDIAVLLFFAYIGRATHYSKAIDFEVVKTAAPFLISWVAVAPLLGVYTNEATSSQGNSLKKLVPAWTVAIPLALAIRAAIKGEVPPTPFIGVSMGATLVLLGTWRAAFVKFFAVDETKESKRGGIFDTVRMVITLINRW